MLVNPGIGGGSQRLEKKNRAVILDEKIWFGRGRTARLKFVLVGHFLSSYVLRLRFGSLRLVRDFQSSLFRLLTKALIFLQIASTECLACFLAELFPLLSLDFDLN